MVLLQSGTTTLPEQVTLMRFRISEVHLRQENGEWLRLSSDLHVVELERGKNGLRRTVLDTRIPPVAYDSLALTFDRIFVQFGENAGAPLTLGSGTPHRLGLRLEPDLNEPTSLLLTFEPGASLSRTDDCRWFFVPLLRTEIIAPPAATEQG